MSSHNTLGRMTDMLFEELERLNAVDVTDGDALAALLDELGIRAKVIETREDRCRDLNERFPRVTAICGDGTDQELLESESMTDYDCFIALTNNDEDNFIISQYAQQKKLPKVITKCSRKNYTGIARAVGLDSVISPKSITAASVSVEAYCNIRA